jgi:hypothetical protein
MGDVQGEPSAVGLYLRKYSMILTEGCSAVVWGRQGREKGKLVERG